MKQPGSPPASRYRRFLAAAAAPLAAATLLLPSLATAQQQPQSYANPGAEVPVLELAHFSDILPQFGASARLIAESYAQLGVRVDLKPMQVPVLVSTITTGQGIKDLAIGQWSGSPNKYGPNFYINTVNHSKSKQNAAFYSNPEYDKLAEAQAKETDPAKRLELVRKAQEIIWKDEPYWPLWIFGTYYVTNRNNFPDLKPIPPMGAIFGLVQYLDATPARPDHKVFVHGWGSDASTWNVLGESQAGYQARHRWVYDTLAQIGYEGKLIPWAAESWSWVDPTHINIKLRKGMKFHDGKPVTVDDAVFSFDFWIKHRPPLWTPMTGDQKSVRKIDDDTFQVELTGPNPEFETTVLTWCVILPKHIWEKVPEQAKNVWEWDPVAANAVIGSGPFKFEYWRRQQGTSFTANKEHFHAPKVDGMLVRQFTSADSAAAAAEAGEMDYVGSPLPPGAMKALAERNPQSLKFVEEEGFTQINLWLNNKKEPFSDPAFRRALHLATPIRRIRDIGNLGLAQINAPGPMPATLKPWAHPSLPEVPYDIAQAKKVLTDAGYTIKDGKLYYPSKK